MIKSELLHSLMLVAENGGISKAAEAKSLSAMALSKQMSKLEQLVGQAVFERSGRQLRLTEFGNSLYREAKSVISAHEALDNWLEQQTGIINGNLSVITQTSEMLTDTIIPWLDEFCQLYPKLNVKLDVKESLININDDDFDVFWGVSDYLGDRFPNLKRRNLWRSIYGVYAAPDYIKSTSHITIDNIEQHHIVGYLHNQPSNVLVLQEDNKPTYKLLRQRVATVGGLIELAIQGLGVINAAHDSRQIKEAIANKTLEPVLSEHWWQNAEIYAYFHNVKHPQPKVKAFVDFFLSKRAQWK
ncbi:LysR family transcriptional regulator [Pseudoalteromonas sp. CnMc7-15]|uniref:LysR family transcriptional regulator n=1 Tax=unclassified Pseudoalteromonas TaxID=194690 RepID=UPI001EF6CFA4|nr:LysR family transcriptional regulator [Pseudoalteromonas sp. CnMc7-15]MCG7565399.1 LysR family transcriptional regulator [Pseudoalteromonas sp. CnMc7-15]